jgi:hypothetical protein
MTVVQLKKRMDGRFSRLSREMNARFTGVDRRLEAVDRRLNDMEAALRVEIGGIARQIESLGDKLGAMIRVLDGTVKEQGRTLDEHEERLKDLERGYTTH